MGVCFELMLQGQLLNGSVATGAAHLLFGYSAVSFVLVAQLLNDGLRDCVLRAQHIAVFANFIQLPNISFSSKKAPDINVMTVNNETGFCLYSLLSIQYISIGKFGLFLPFLFNQFTNTLSNISTKPCERFQSHAISGAGRQVQSKRIGGLSNH